MNTLFSLIKQAMPENGAKKTQKKSGDLTQICLKFEGTEPLSEFHISYNK